MLKQFFKKIHDKVLNCILLALRRYRLKSKAFLDGIRNYYRNKSLGLWGVHEISGSDIETDILAGIWEKHKFRMESAIKSLTEREISNTFGKEDENFKKGMRADASVIIQFFESCLTDSQERTENKNSAEQAEKAEAELHEKTQGTPLSC